MGHGHEGNHHDMKIPDASIYKLEDAPELVKFQQNLAKRGLKDPWLRNHVWRYNPKYGTQLQRWGWTLFRGWKVGLGAFLVTIACEKAFGITYDYSHQMEHDEGKDH